MQIKHKKLCENCLYFNKIKYNTQDFEHEECRFNPPIPVLQSDGRVVSNFPSVIGNKEWCGKFEVIHV